MDRPTDKAGGQPVPPAVGGWRQWLAAAGGGRTPPSGTARLVLLGLMVWLLVGVIFSASLYGQRVNVQVGDVAPKTVVAPFAAIDYASTAAARAAAARAVPPVYSTDPHVLTSAQQAAANDFQTITNLSADAAVPLAAREATASSAIPIGLPQSVWGEVLTLPPATLAGLSQDTNVILASVLGNGTGVRNTSTSLAEAKGFIGDLANTEEPDPGLRLFLTSLSTSLLKPNTFVNKTQTTVRRQAAEGAVPDVRIFKGQRVIVAGKVVTAGEVRALSALGLLNRGFDPAPLAGGFLFGLVLAAVEAGFLWGFRRQMARDWSRLLIWGVVTVLGLLAAQLLAQVPEAAFVIVPTAAILLATLVDPTVAIMTAAVLATATGLLSGTDLPTAVVAWFGSVAGVVGVSRLSNRHDVIRVGLLVGVVNLATLLSLDFMSGAALVQVAVWQQLVWAFVDGALAAVLVVGSTPFLEAPFGIVSAVRLIELSGPNQPLLRKLLVEAPGTYLHSIMVGNLAEAATEAVGGDALLARVGAIYHDVGKLKRPYFFIDNQYGAENPHDKLAPSLSSLIIGSHVKDGVELARQHRLPDVIQQFIRQHHGTTVMRYFYEKARDLDTGEGVAEVDFRYEGPKPQTKEAAIVMLADASEATTRTLKNPNAQSIEQVVRRLIRERLEDGQLDEANLTLRDLDTVARTFTRVLTGVFHTRIEYPDPVLKEMERSQKRGDMGHESARRLRRVGGDGSSGPNSRPQ